MVLKRDASQVSLVPPPTAAVCVCDAGWGGVGCNQQVTELASGEPAPVQGVPGGDWLFYQFTLPQPGALVAEMRRSAGDPILFLKAQNEGVEVRLTSSPSLEKPHIVQAM